MPSYEFYCEDCKIAQEITQSILLPLPEKCPKCNSDKWSQRYTGGLDGFVEQEATTVGQLGERNARKMGKERHDKKCDELLGPTKVAQRDAPRPWWRDDDKPLDLSKVKNTERYIKTGRKD